ncbi:hypothetical protein INH39_29230 [Massilia violaceinigra]|uniref:Uncharacterized protein n=1 Tax=Massilia violaceinigra TaxID=2045208 RepID=A0ABY4A7A8_9BURK|nr:hypothetical protein [Massilia violaceinigra]UOD29441.1 hypothetical protein INH39_29230 [Massilia violaceinigra]
MANRAYLFEGEDPIALELPCTSVERTVENLSRALPHFEAIAGDKEIGKAHWQRTMDTLTALPLPVLAMNALEFTWLGKPLAFAASIKQACGDGPAPIAQIKQLSCYKDGGAPMRSRSTVDSTSAPP